MKTVFVPVITAGNAVKTDVIVFRNYIFILILNYIPMISFEASKIDKKMLTFLKLSRNNTVVTLLVAYLYR
jgi:hypothetical protein